MEEKKYESDALQRPPSFDEMVELIKKLFTDYLEYVMKTPPSEIGKAWDIYKTLNHLYPDVSQPTAVWIKALDRLPGWGKKVKWREPGVYELPSKFSISEMTNYNPNALLDWEWYDEGNESPAEQPVVSQDAHEKEVMIQAFYKVRQIFEGRRWIMEGRGSYPYNDDRYKEEVRYMYNELDVIVKDTWANIKSKSVDYRKAIIAEYLAGAAEQPGREVEAVKRIAVAFMRWNSHMYNEGRDRQRDKWFNHKGECVANSTPDLYDQFYELIVKQGYQPWLFRDQTPPAEWSVEKDNNKT